MRIALSPAGDDPAADAVLVPDTALTTTQHIAGLEVELGKPVLTANQVTIWYALQVAGVLTQAPGFGRLLALSTARGHDGAETSRERELVEEITP